MWDDVGGVIAHVDACVDKARKGVSKLPPGIFHVRGMSGSKTRMLYNAMCEPPGTRYLEIGCWAGSTFVSALHGNPGTHGTVIDDWSEFGGPCDEFFKNVRTWLPATADIKVLEGDYLDLAPALEPGKFNVYLYDGPHSEESHADAVTKLYHALAKPCVFMVDDWAFESVRKGTKRGLDEVGATIAHVSEVLPFRGEDPHGFWNGICIFVLA